MTNSTVFNESPGYTHKIIFIHSYIKLIFFLERVGENMKF